MHADAGFLNHVQAAKKPAGRPGRLATLVCPRRLGKVLGMNHPSTLATVNNMAEVFMLQRDYIKALDWLQRALNG